MEKINLNTEESLLVVVDIINGFIYEGALADPYIERIIEPTIELITAFDKAQQAIIAFVDSHQENSREFIAYPEHCVEGSSESQLVAQLLPYQEKMLVIDKNSTNGMMTDFFLSYINQYHYRNIVIVGCCTDICILQFALTLQAFVNEHNLDTRVIVVKEAVETFDSPQHQRDYYNEISYKLMSNAGITLLDTLKIEG